MCIRFCLFLSSNVRACADLPSRTISLCYCAVYFSPFLRRCQAHYKLLEGMREGRTTTKSAPVMVVCRVVVALNDVILCHSRINKQVQIHF